MQQMNLGVELVLEYQLSSAAVEPATSSVADVVGTWTRQMGYPFIRVNTDGKTL